MAKKAIKKAPVKNTEAKVSEGLGDTLGKIFESTGVTKLVKFIAGEDCGCEERKQKLNELFPYNKPLCLLEDEYVWLDKFFEVNKATITPSEQQAILPIYNRVMRHNKRPSNCSDCWRDIVRSLKVVYLEYKTEE